MDAGIAVGFQRGLSVTSDTLGAALETSYNIFADNPAIWWRGRTASYRELGAAAAGLADSYRQLGVGKGDRVICQLRNGPDFLIAALAAWKVGAIHVGLDRDLTPVEVVRMAEFMRPTVLLANGRGGTDLPTLVGLLRHAAIPVVVVSDSELVPAGCLCLSSLLSGGAVGVASAPTHLSPEDPAVILVTSGTTGQPKGVVRHHGQLLGHWKTTATFLNAGPEDKHLVQLPLAYGFGFGLAVAGLLTGGVLMVLDHFSARPTLRLIARERITILNGTPPHFALILADFDRSRVDVSSLRCGAGSGASFPPSLLARIFSEFGMDFVYTYGCSEGLGWKTTDKDEMLKGSVGRPPSHQIRVVGADGRPLPLGQVGEIVVRKTHPVVYWGHPLVHTRDPDWHHMGDLGRVDEDGYLYVFGRTTMQINRGGLKVDPGEVESVALTHAELRDAAVVGVPDPVVGEVICICTVPREGSGPSLEQLRGYLGRSLATNKLPEKLCVLDRIPRTKIGKVDRVALRELAVQKQGESWRGRRLGSRPDR